jgi:hypothetical protein
MEGECRHHSLRWRHAQRAAHGKKEYQAQEREKDVYCDKKRICMCVCVLNLLDVSVKMRKKIYTFREQKATLLLSCWCERSNIK